MQMSPDGLMCGWRFNTSIIAIVWCHDGFNQFYSSSDLDMNIVMDMLWNSDFADIESTDFCMVCN